VIFGRQGTVMSAGSENTEAAADAMDKYLPRVFIVGAGPGNPGLLTLRALECLRQAEVVIYDRLVPERLLDFVSETAERIPVGSLPGRHAERCPHITAALLDAALGGKRVVRLKGGDPFLFGRGAEEAAALKEAGIAYEIVPGVTAGTAASAFAGIPLTHRLHASAVAIIAGHECAKPDSVLDWPALACFPGTLVFYMGIANLPLITEKLLTHGKPSSTPAAAVRWGTTGEQRTVEAPLGELAAAVRAAELDPPALVIIGEVARLRSQIAWWENRPLFGRRIIVTRPRKQAEPMMRMLEQLGAVGFSLPTVAIREPADWSPTDRAVAGLERFDWLVFTSVNGVHAFIRRLRHLGRDLRYLGRVKIAAIGPGTAEGLREYHLDADLVPARFDSESLAASLRERAKGARILLARADRGRELLREELLGAATVEQITVYSQVDTLDPLSSALQQLRDGSMDAVTLTSSNIARALYAGLDAQTREIIGSGTVALVSISPITSAAIRELGWPVAEEAKEATTQGVIDALVRHISRERDC
jgi:uroporphyrinogen III methyltransferase/synthase